MRDKKINISELVVCTRKLVMKRLEIFYDVYPSTHRRMKINKMLTMSNDS